MREPKLGHFVFRFGYFAKNCKLLGVSLLQRVQIDQSGLKCTGFSSMYIWWNPLQHHLECDIRYIDSQSSFKYLRKAKCHNVKLLR